MLVFELHGARMAVESGDHDARIWMPQSRRSAFSFIAWHRSDAEGGGIFFK